MTRPTTAAPADPPPDGVLLLDKPPGVTSHDVVQGVRRALGGRRARRVGHAGTLDPFATGLLLVLLGRATRIQDRLMRLEKTYETLARLGATSTTGDPEGEIVVTGRYPPEPLTLPVGRIRQRPSAYSAIRVDGERAYARARRGETVAIPEREVTVYEFSLLDRDGDDLRLRVRCSSGTYVRTLVADLGDAYCRELRRTAIGPFTVADAQPVDVPPARWRVHPLAEVLPVVLPTVELDADQARRAGFGQRIVVPGAPDVPELALRHAGEAIAVARREPDGRFHPVVGFRT